MSEEQFPNSNELAIELTEFAQHRIALAEERTELARERTRAAQERTLMAWIRTSLSMLAFGFGISRFFEYLEKTETGRNINASAEGRLLGLSLMVLGIFALIVALISHWFTLKNIQKKDFKYIPNWSLGFIVGTILLFIGSAAFIPLVADNFNLTDIFTLDSQVIKNLIALTIFTIMLTMGAKIPLTDFASVKNHPKFLAKSLLSVLVLFPLIVFLILLVFPTNKATAIALIILAASPGPPLLTKRAMMAGGRMNFGASLQVILSLSAVIFTPLILFIFAQLIPGYQGNINFLLVAKQIAIVQLLPLSLGLIIREISAELAEEISNLLFNIANTLFFVMVLFAIFISFNLIPLAGWQAAGIIALIIPPGLIIGHLLGGIEQRLDTRSTLATATVARNVGLALFIAIANGATIAIPILAAYLILGVILSLPYNIWIKKQIAALAT
ncbi:DUF202 domain-containing protein [Xenococcus sp. PCC 7305]|uniref:DUF202 domain-containing protein n=1 Tax=Xenococcus sp. PCC 7305 TaxID=102125 RepID=UPI00030C2ED4|nr:DUF202 domain-containing protein [Xenococcus sp. PCC 7305]